MAIEQINPSYYAILTADMRYDNNLSDFDKVLGSDITALCNKNGYCTASNHYFAEVFNKSKDTISKRISNLVKEGYYKSVLIYKKGTKEVVERRLYPLSKTSIPLDENADTPICKNAEDNNTSINTTSIKNKQKNFSFSLSKSTAYKYLSAEYKQNLLAYAVTQVGNRAKDLLDSMIDHHSSKGSRFLDWAAAFRTWKRNDEKFNISKPAFKSKEPEVGSLNWMAAQEANRVDAIDVEALS